MRVEIWLKNSSSSVFPVPKRLGWGLAVGIYIARVLELYLQPWRGLGRRDREDRLVLRIATPPYRVLNITTSHPSSLFPDINKLVREGYRNVIVDDPSLENASTDTIRKRHIQWVKGRNYPRYIGTPPFDYCLVPDERSIRSFLASSEPKSDFGLVGYVNVIDCDFDPNNPGNECSEFYKGSLRICLGDLFSFALYCEKLRSGEQQ